MSASDAWLDTRSPAPPQQLRACMSSAIQAVSDGDAITAGVLGEAALYALRAAIARCDERAAALDLLAADALLTYMMEAAAEQGTEAIEAAAEAYGNARLVQLITADA